ncbi:hypothetical protein JW898_04045 [Candidatus Woesearchaeota archaeon]|nr:hypothetical protein [Candidatus Woesearchaeota archaeon]
MEVKELLQKRRLLKRKKPEFIRQDAHKRKKLSWNWRKPRGSDSKMRVSRRGYKRQVRKGWGSPSLVKGLDRTGLTPFTANRPADLANADPKKHIIIIGGSVGTKKKVAIIEQALSKHLKIANFKDPSKLVTEVKEQFEKKKKDKEKLKEERAKKREAAKKEAEKKKEKEKKEKEKEKSRDEAAEMTEEEKKIEEKKEKDKMLISTQ